MTTWADNLYRFYKDLKPPAKLPNDVLWLYPQKDPKVMELVQLFFRKYFNDGEPRTLLLGINPGRFGAGVTGVNFTAPKQLTEDCGIDHGLKLQSEMSAEFIYDVIHAYGGVEAFYRRFFIGSVCPLGFIRHGKNINYYDDKDLLEAVEPFIIKNIKKLLTFPFTREQCFCIGEGRNYQYLSGLNERYKWFGEIVPLRHPRPIMQYKRKQKDQFVHEYVEALTASAPMEHP
jgi:hypothetical protein